MSSSSGGEAAECSWCDTPLVTRLESVEHRCAVCLLVLGGGRDWTLTEREAAALHRLVRQRVERESPQ